MTFTLYHVVAGTPTSVGTIVFHTDKSYTVTFASPVTFNASDALKITMQASADATGADIGFNFLTNIL